MSKLGIIENVMVSLSVLMMMSLLGAIVVKSSLYNDILLLISMCSLAIFVALGCYIMFI